jgi:hypothetical protein
MRGGYGTHVHMIERHAKQPDGSWKIVEQYWEAGSPRGKHTTMCGHKHQTEDDARGCMDAVEQEYRAKRWTKRCAA